MKLGLCKVMRLVNGDVIVCMVDEAFESVLEKDFVTVYNPVQLLSKTTKLTETISESFILKPWMPLCDDDSFIIKMENVLTIGLASLRVIRNYVLYIQEQKDFKEQMQDAVEHSQQISELDDDYFDSDEEQPKLKKKDIN
jgi:hypothetical protein